jgi:hypothetical protein
VSVSASPRLYAACLAAVAGLAPAPVAAFEQPPSFRASSIPGIKPVGDNYRVREPVRSDGLLRVYSLETSYGEVRVQGDQMLRMRINELVALHQLEKISESEQFGKALAEAGISPLKYTGRLITDPVKTIGDTGRGIGSFFGGIGSGMANAGKTDHDDPVLGALGVSTQRRQLAARFGVDPYTDFEPLKFKLARLSEASATAGLAVSGALFFVPGAAGIVVSNLKTADTLGDIQIDDLARDYSASQILDLNRQRLLAMGVDQNLAESVLANRNYSPVDMAAMVAAIDSLSGVQDRAVFFRRAATVDSRTIAYFMRRHAEMLSAHHARSKNFVRFVSLGGYPFNVTREGRVVGLMPIDAMSWTASTAEVINRSVADLQRGAGSAQAELRITGRATPLAKRELKALGWTVVENVRI